MSEAENSLGFLIRQARNQYGLSQRQLAHLIHMDCAELSRIEAGKRKKPNLLYLKGLAEVLNLDLILLMQRAGYDQEAISLSKDLEDILFIKKYRRQLENYKEFYSNLMKEIEERRKTALLCKGIFADIIDRIDHSNFYSNSMTIKEVSQKLKEASRILNRNIEKIEDYISFDID